MSNYDNQPGRHEGFTAADSKNNELQSSAKEFYARVKKRVARVLLSVLVMTSASLMGGSAGHRSTEKNPNDALSDQSVTTPSSTEQEEPPIWELPQVEPTNEPPLATPETDRGNQQVEIVRIAEDAQLEDVFGGTDYTEFPLLKEQVTQYSRPPTYSPLFRATATLEGITIPNPIEQDGPQFWWSGPKKKYSEEDVILKDRNGGELAEVDSLDQIGFGANILLLANWAEDSEGRVALSLNWDNASFTYQSSRELDTEKTLQITNVIVRIYTDEAVFEKTVQYEKSDGGWSVVVPLGFEPDLPESVRGRNVLVGPKALGEIKAIEVILEDNTDPNAPQRLRYVLPRTASHGMSEEPPSGDL